MITAKDIEALNAPTQDAEERRKYLQRASEYNARRREEKAAQKRLARLARKTA